MVSMQSTLISIISVITLIVVIIVAVVVSLRYFLLQRSVSVQAACSVMTIPRCLLQNVVFL